MDYHYKNKLMNENEYKIMYIEYIFIASLDDSMRIIKNI